jgi:hypothetical protein
MSLEAQLADYNEVRESNRVTAIELLPLIPDHIPGSTKRTSPENLRWLLNRVIEQIDVFPLDKIGRWVGFVQGVLALSGNMDVDAERERTRDRMQDAYKATGQIVPITMEMPDK